MDQTHTPLLKSLSLESTEELFFNKWFLEWAFAKSGNKA